MLPDIFRSERCQLRPLTLADIEAVYAYSKDPDWGRYLPVPQPYLREHAEFYIRLQLEADRAKTPTWAIELESRVVGIANLIIDGPKSSAEIGISLDQNFWGQGLASEVLQQLIKLAFAELPELCRIEGFADQRNAKSRALLDRLNFQFEGIVRSRRSVRGERIDDALYSLLRSDVAPD